MRRINIQLSNGIEGKTMETKRIIESLEKKNNELMDRVKNLHGLQIQMRKMNQDDKVKYNFLNI